jgi:hypothetical protein
MFGDKCRHLPKRWIPLRGNGCRRIPHDHRPHTFEIILGPRRSFQFAAADEYEASDWLQAFIQAASGVSLLAHAKASILSTGYFFLILCA